VSDHSLLLLFGGQLFTTSLCMPWSIVVPGRCPHYCPVTIAELQFHGKCDILECDYYLYAFTVVFVPIQHMMLQC